MVGIQAAGALVGGDATNGLDVDVTRVSGTVTTTSVGTVAHDAAGTGASPVLVGGYASTAAPADVSTDGDAVRAWYLKNGAQAAVITAAGALIGGDATNGLDVDVTRLSGSDVAHDAADSGNPHKIGVKARTALPTAVAASDRADAFGDIYGRLLIAHSISAMQKSYAFNTTSTETGGAIWTPAAGKRIVVTSLTISTYGTQAGRIILWFGGAADTTYSAGTDQPLEIMSAVPSADGKPGLTKVYPNPVHAITADHVLRITTDAAMSVDVVVHGYELD